MYLKWLKTLLKIGEAAADIGIKNPEKKKVYEAVKEVVNPIVLKDDNKEEAKDGRG